MPRPEQAAAREPISANDEPRRGFLGKAAAVVIGGLIAVFPAAAGMFTFCDPLRARARGGNGGDKEKPGRLVRVTSLEAVPDDGVPRQFPVIADRQDAWNRFPDEAIGAVYLRRTKGSEGVEAFNAICPHAGCFVNFDRKQNVYQCPCHDSSFDLSGKCQHGPSPRSLDALDTELRPAGKEQYIWVRFVNYYAGKKEQIAK
ncbi:MAG TPA: Rieske 2Fe-2S domain-containing protein [Pirellulales bacterium]|nr:Rieske 2Fe-2S domain-containing protein [Pirellulales bacterium]